MLWDEDDDLFWEDFKKECEYSDLTSLLEVTKKQVVHLSRFATPHEDKTKRPTVTQLINTISEAQWLIEVLNDESSGKQSN